MTTESFAGGRYRVERALGHGGMATVLLARDGELGRPVAVKLLAENLAADAELRERFEREARAAARLSHPNIVGVFDVGEEAGRPYIVMEYVQGGTLAGLLVRRGTLAPGEAAELGRQIALALAHAHAAGLVHRDVKPENVLLTEDGTPKVADFGIARAAGAARLTQTGAVLGTLGYLAPAQAAGEPVTAAADVYALGAVLVELLTGRALHGSRSLEERRRQAEWPALAAHGPPSELPRGLREALERSLALEPRERPSAAELAESLTGTDPSRAPTVVARAGRSWRPSRRLQAAALATLAAAAALAGLALARGETPAPAPAPPPIQPVEHAPTPGEQARNLSTWLRRYSR